MLKTLFVGIFNSSWRARAGAVAVVLTGGLVSSASLAFAQAATPTRVAAPSCSTSQSIQLLVENPSPGDLLVPGNNLVINGVAFDLSATQGSGIDRVSAYLGNRDAGGVFLGNAVLGQANPLAPSGSQFATAGFSLRSGTLPAGSGARDLFVYAHSSASDKEGSADVPVFLGAVPTPVKGQVPTAVLPTAVPCTPTPVPVATSTPTSPPLAPSAPLPTVVPAVLPTLAPIPTLPPLAPAVPPMPAATPTPRPVTATAPASASASATAPRGGGIPAELGVGILALGAVLVSSGLAWRRRERGASTTHSESGPPTRS